MYLHRLIDRTVASELAGVVYDIFTVFVKPGLVFVLAEANLFQTCLSNFARNSIRPIVFNKHVFSKKREVPL